MLAEMEPARRLAASYAVEVISDVPRGDCKKGCYEDSATTLSRLVVAVADGREDAESQRRGLSLPLLKEQ